jgi:8-oxo-dGTP pyrophosphatase MutT (NUDIX family)
MGAGILPITRCSDGKIYFLFGKENKYEDSASGWSDFGGGTDNNETFFQTACREGSEELTGFLGSSSDIAHLLKRGIMTIDYTEPSGKHGTYRTHLVPIKYDPMLPYYYNNNQRFLQKHLDPKIIQSTKIFEKAEIRWICIDHLKKMRKQFRSFFQHIIDEILAKKYEIMQFVKELPKKNRQKSKKNTRKNRQKSKKNKTNKYI